MLVKVDTDAFYLEFHWDGDGTIVVRNGLGHELERVTFPVSLTYSEAFDIIADTCATWEA